MKPSKHAQFWALLLLVVLFGLGFGSGWLAHRYITHSSVEKNRARRARGQWRKRFLKRLSTRLKLSKKQQASVVEILDKYRPEYRSIRTSIRPKLRAMRTRMRTDIQALLQAPQRKRFQQMIQEAELRRAKRRKRRDKRFH